MNLNFFPHNPIAKREIRFYERNSERWLLRLETGGVITLAFTLCLLFVVYWLHNHLEIISNIFYLTRNYDFISLVQLFVGVVYLLALLRSTSVGVQVAHRYRQFSRGEIAITGLPVRTLIIGLWIGGMYQLRGWITALSLVRIVVVVVLTIDDKILTQLRPTKFDMHPMQLYMAVGFAILLSFLDVWATVGIGLLARMWLRNNAIAWIAANVLRVLPALIFIWFPTYHVLGSTLNFLVVRWYEYTWFAFVDGGTSALLRLIIPSGYPSYLMARGLLSFFAAAHMLAVYLAAVWIFMNLRLYAGEDIMIELNVLRKRLLHRRYLSKKAALENFLIASLSIPITLSMILLWAYERQANLSSEGVFPYNLSFLNHLQWVLWIAISLTTLRAIIAGIYLQVRTQYHALSVYQILQDSLKACRQISGWGFSLGVILIAAFGLLILEYNFNFQLGSLYSCLPPNNTANCFHYSTGWLSIQWVLGLTLAVVLSWAVLFSSSVIGVCAKTIFYKRAIAVVFSVCLRLIPVLLVMLPPHFQVVINSSGFLPSLWRYDPLLTVADTGINALFGLAEPSRLRTQFNYEAHTHIGFGILSATLVLYMLLGYILISVFLVYLVRSRTNNVGSKSTQPSDRHRHQSASAQL